MKLNRLISLMFLLCFVKLTFAQTLIKPNQDSLEENWELLQDKVPISGNVRVGLMIKGGVKNPEIFYAIIPDTIPSTNLCVELSSVDGRYSANLDYTISPNDAGIKGFELPTKHKNELAKYNTDELVILASLGNDCRKPEVYVVSSWNNFKSSEKNEVNVFINSISQVKLRVIANNGNKQDFECKSLKSKLVAYNKKCTMPNANLEDIKSILVKKRIQRGGVIKFIDYKFLLKK